MSVPIKKWKGTKQRVEKLLQDYPECRDNIDLTIARMWMNDVPYGEMSAFVLLSKLSKGELTPTETIRRSWQLLQMKNPELRGKKYNERHKKSVEVRKEIVNE